MTYIFIIDTNMYAGNFEREMCAYLTGLYIKLVLRGNR